MKRKDLCAWESEYGGTTAEGIAKRVINKFNLASTDITDLYAFDGSVFEDSSEFSSTVVPGFFDLDVLYCIIHLEHLFFAGPASRLRVPKTWKSAVALFKASNRDSIKMSNCSASAKEINAILNQRWDALSDAEKEEWNSKSEEDKKRWLVEVDEYQKAAQINETDFTSAALGIILRKCFDADGVSRLVSKCLISDSEAFAPLNQASGSSKGELIKALCSCSPPGCQSPADLLRYLAEVN